MDNNWLYREAEYKIDVARNTDTISLSLRDMKLTKLPESLEHLTKLTSLDLSYNELESLPKSLEHLTNLTSLDLSYNKLELLPESLGHLKKLTSLNLSYNKLKSLPKSLGRLRNLQSLKLADNQITDIPSSLIRLNNFDIVIYYDSLIDQNPLNPELAAAFKHGLEAVKAYLRAKVEGGEIRLNEAKLVLVGEGGVGKTSLLAALRGEPWIENRATTHGVEVVIKSLGVQDSKSSKQITLNGWDFGGQNIYRHTHQLFFTAPAVYLAVWDPRRGPEQCCVNEWCKMIKHRAYDETRHGERPRILIVATHGGPKERLDHIDEQALRDEFGDLICGFYHIDSKPNAKGVCYQLNELKNAIAREAAAIPSIGRSVPLSWKNVLGAC